MGCYVDWAPVDIITDTATDIFTYTRMQRSWHPVRHRIPAEHLLGNLSNRKICDGNANRIWELLPSEVLPAPLPAMATRRGQGKWWICCCGKNVSENLLFISLNHNFWRYFNLKTNSQQFMGRSFCPEKILLFEKILSAIIIKKLDFHWLKK